MLVSTSRRLLRPALRLVTSTRQLSSPTPWNTNYNYPELVPPKTINDEMALGIQDAVDLFIRHGIGRQRLQSLAAAKMPTVQKWQIMMECYMATQIHVLAGLGYPTDESGLSAYHSHLGEFMQGAATPDTQEMWKENGRDTWRLVLTTAFGMESDDFEEKDIGTFIGNNVLDWIQYISLQFYCFIVGPATFHHFTASDAVPSPPKLRPAILRTRYRQKCKVKIFSRW